MTRQPSADTCAEVHRDEMSKRAGRDIHSIKVTAAENGFALNGPREVMGTHWLDLMADTTAGAACCGHVPITREEAALLSG